MNWVYIIISFLCAGAIVHSYIFYPAWLTKRSKGKSLPDEVWSEDGVLPRVFLLFAAYNEASIIREKLEHTFATHYPMERLTVWVGSDGSDDGTDDIVTEFGRQYENLKLFRYNERAGKAVVINKLMEDLHDRYDISQQDVLIFTDANIIFEQDTIYQLVKHFKRSRVGQVGANVLNRGVDEQGISEQEQFYISRENTIKYHEGLNWGYMMGAFGACYALRANLYPVIPRNFLMEDFYISMRVLKQGQEAILVPEARCWEDLPNEMEEEFKRKIRISAGNFQNLSVYYPFLFAPFKPLGFAFLSHKVIRCVTPFLLIILLACSVMLYNTSALFKGLFWLQLILLFTPLLDRMAQSGGIRIPLLRYIGYFYAMNAALLMGFVKYLKGVRTNVWKPTKRTTSVH